MNVAGMELRDPEPVGGGDICRAHRAVAPDGAVVFVKTRSDAPSGFFAAEARGLDRLRVPAGPPLPAVVAVADDGLVLSWVEQTGPSASAAEELGRALARLHATSQPSYGGEMAGFIGSLPLDNRPPDQRAADDWPAFYVERRVLPFVAGLSAQERADVDRLCAHIDEVAGPPEPPALVHGDLWSGNLVWSAEGPAYLVDPASAHAGHRETDLAMLALFGTPHLDRLVAAYGEVYRLADGWRRRVPLHQLHPLLVHATLFGGGYAARAAECARAALGG